MARPKVRPRSPAAGYLKPHATDRSATAKEGALLDLSINPDLRNRLDEITDHHADEVGIGLQPKLVADLAKDFSHAISLVSETIPGRPETYRYTCFQHALDLTSPAPIVVRIANVRPDEVYIS